MSVSLTSKQQYWAELLDKAEQSGQPVAQYAKEQNIPAEKLYQWRSTLKKITTTETTRQEIQFAEWIPDNVGNPMLSIQLSEATLNFCALPDPQWLSCLLQQVRTP